MAVCTKSAKTKAVMASTIGTARTATHASIRDGGVDVFALDICSSVCGLEGVGLNTQRKVMGVPSAMPPAIPPVIRSWLFVRYISLPVFAIC